MNNLNNIENKLDYMTFEDDGNVVRICNLTSDCYITSEYRYISNQSNVKVLSTLQLEVVVAGKRSPREKYNTYSKSQLSAISKIADNCDFIVVSGPVVDPLRSDLKSQGYDNSVINKITSIGNLVF